MRTLLLTPDLFLSEGGIARIMRLYLRALGELSGPGDSVRYCALLDHGDTKERAREFGGSALAMHWNGGGSRTRLTWRTLNFALDSDLLICGHLHFLPLAGIAKIVRPSLRYALVAHGIEVWRPYSLIEKLSLRHADRIFCVSEYTRRQLLRFDSALRPERLVVVPNTFDPKFESPDEPVHAAGKPGPTLLAVSRLVSTDPYKGVDTVVEAMPAIRRIFPTARLRVVGGGDDLPRLQEIARKLAVTDAVTFLGPVSDEALKNEYRSCDIFALPSRKEGFGLVYLEAMAYGKPCIAARAGGAPEVVDRRVGELVAYGNVEQIALAVADLINHPRKPEAIHARAAEFAYPNFKQRLATQLAAIV